MTANAGQTPYSGTSSTRGNPEGSATEVTGDHIKMVWSWGLSQGNGPISCVCLTHQEAGDCGLLPDGTLPLLKSTGLNIPGINHFSADALSDSSLTRARCIAMPIKLDNDGNGIFRKPSEHIITSRKIIYFITLTDFVSFVDSL